MTHIRKYNIYYTIFSHNFFLSFSCSTVYPLAFKFKPYKIHVINLLYEGIFNYGDEFARLLSTPVACLDMPIPTSGL